MKTLTVIAATLGLGYLLIVAFYALMQRNLVYYPQTIAIGDARQLAGAQGGAPWLDADGDWQGWRFSAGTLPAERAAARAVVFHGNAGMALQRGYYGRLLADFGMSGPWTTYVLEYPGFGPRGGSPSQGSLVAAALAAVDRLQAQDPAPLLIIGESLGSGVAAQVARQRPDAVAALLLVTPFDSMVNVARHHMPWLPAGLLLRDRFDNLAALEGFRGPLVVVTAGEDHIVPARLAEPLLRQHAGPLRHEQQAAAGHNTLHFDPLRAPWPSVDRFLGEQLGR